MKKIFLLHSLIIFSVVFGGCNCSGKRQTLKGIYGKVFCLDVQKTESFNKIRIGEGTLTLNKNMTFKITNDSLKYSNITGTWDICCYDSDFGNYIFRVKGLNDWKTSLPEIYIKTSDGEVKLIFRTCP
ncbi:MAG: hypothetical protein JNJ86_01150 [Chitinophagaceae bacterium]|jgi:hypothetical protein|nr:hypothetical protein [Chitinophagaceae bacterium]